MGVKISELPASAGAARAMLFEVSNAGVSERLTLSQMFALSTGAVTTDSPLLNMAQSWASGGVTFSGWKLNVTDTASAADSKLLDLQVGGNPVFAIRKDGNFIWGSNAMVFCLAGVYEAYFGPGMVAIAGQVGLGETPFNADVMMHRDGPNTLALVNAANPQEFRLYNRFTDASNYERASLSWSKVTGYFVLSTDCAGTGTARPLWLNSAMDLYFTAGGAGSAQWKLTQSGHLHANTDDAYDIGGPANRPRNAYLSGFLSAGTVAAGVLAGDISAARDASSGVLYLGSDGHCYIYRDGGNNLMFGGYTSMQLTAWCHLGGTTASFPSFKRNAGEVHVRLADDSDFAQIRGRVSTHAAAVSETITPNKTLLFYDSSGTAYKVACVAA